MTAISGPGLPVHSVWEDALKAPSGAMGLSDVVEEPKGEIASKAEAPRETEADREAAEAEVRRKAALTFLALYRETHGAPEEKEQDRVQEEPDPDDETEEEKARRRKDSGQILNTIGETVEDPDDPDKVHVLVKKIDGEGKAKYTRNVTIDNGGSGGGEPVGEPADGSARSAVFGRGKGGGRPGASADERAGQGIAARADRTGPGILSSGDDEETVPVV